MQRLHKDLKRANQGQCFVCGLYTTFCGGCRLNFCFTPNRHDELETLVEQGKLGGGVDLLMPVLKMKVMHPDTGVVTELFCQWSCYHIQHSKQISEIMNDKK